VTDNGWDDFWDRATERIWLTNDGAIHYCSAFARTCRAQDIDLEWVLDCVADAVYTEGGEDRIDWPAVKAAMRKGVTEALECDLSA
jgi:hypothetical protein